MTDANQLSPSGSSEVVVDLLFREAQAVGERAFQATVAVRAVNIGAAFVSIAIGISLVNDYVPLVLLGPLLLSLVLAHNSFLIAEAVHLGGYRAALEDEIQRRLGVAVLGWESRVAPIRHRSPALTAIRVFVVLLWLIVAELAIRTAALALDPGAWGHGQAPVLMAGTLAEVSICGVLLLRAFFDETHGHDEAWNATASLLATSKVAPFLAGSGKSLER